MMMPSAMPPTPIEHPASSWIKRTESAYVRSSGMSGKLGLGEALTAYASSYADTPPISQRTLLGISVMPNLIPLADAIEASREMLIWEDDWDGEGSCGYSEATWTRALTGLLEAAHTLSSLQPGLQPGILKTPDISHGPEGSIDIMWNTPERRLLVNVPRSGDKPASYYGYAPCAETKGTFDPSDVHKWQMLILW